MAQGFGNIQRLDVGLKVDPRVVLSSMVLQLTQAELEQTIETELNENPALERIEEDYDPITENTILQNLAPQELRPASEDAEFKRSLPNDEGTLDWTDLAVAGVSLSDHLRAQLLPQLPPNLRNTGDYVIESLSPNGYFEESLEQVALATNCSLEEAESVLSKLKECEPTGIGAENLVECLLLQLRDADTLERKLARAILKNHLDDFVARRTMKIARKFQVMPDVVERAYAEVQSLCPFPGEAFHGSTFGRANRSIGVTPDLILNHTEQGWQIEVKGSDPSAFKINDFYQQRLQDLKGRTPNQDEKRHVGVYVQRAQDFLRSLDQRRRTLHKIGEYLTQQQSGFVATGDIAFMQPLTRSKLAEDIGIHESTVSRATASKFVQIANGEVVSFEIFFKPALRIQRMIEEILRTENPDAPLSDERIAEMLSQRGVQVARRTVNKYRDRTRLLSSRRRRSA